GTLRSTSLLLEWGASPAVRSTAQDTPMIVATRRDREEIVRLLLDKGAHVDECGENKESALRIAVSSGSLRVFHLLLERGASTAAKDRYTLLMLAARSGHEDIVRFLLDTGAHIEERDGNGSTALHYAAHQGHLGVISILIERGASYAA
ncbi:ankyrin, partial [Schizophyllum commune H4-8]|uniref:ankyrin n=1 Tax=Schizophyllum commune (strain H4-8 / FGSC 9210) TaxID=578458 RepID=UPI00215E71E6